jgi:2-haloacid dehalogenase
MALLFCKEVIVSARMRWITFDCFGTLVDWRAGFTGAIRSLFGERTDDVLSAYYLHEAVVERLSPHRSYKEVLVMALARAAQDCGLSIAAEDARSLANAWASMPVFDDVEPMLAELRREGWKLAVLTNCDEDLFALTHRQFRAPFDLVLTAERVRGYKPAPWHFLGFERLTRVDRRDWVHVANSWYHDISPARALGIQHVWLDRDRTGETGVPALAHVHSAAGVPQAARRFVERIDPAALPVCC